jgi:hypothetical protein
VQHLRPFVHPTGHEQLLGGGPLKFDTLLRSGSLDRREVSPRGLLVTTRKLQHLGQPCAEPAHVGRRRRCRGMLEANAKEACGLIEGQLGGRLLPRIAREACGALAVSCGQPVHRQGLRIDVWRCLERMCKGGVMLTGDRRFDLGDDGFADPIVNWFDEFPAVAHSGTDEPTHDEKGNRVVNRLDARGHPECRDGGAVGLPRRPSRRPCVRSLEVPRGARRLPLQV